MKRWGQRQWVCGVHLHAGGGALVLGLWHRARLQGWDRPHHWVWPDLPAQPLHWAQAMPSVLQAWCSTERSAPLAVAVSLDDACFERRFVDLPPWLAGEDLSAALAEAWAQVVGDDEAWALDFGPHVDGIDPENGSDMRRHEVYGLRQADLNALSQVFEGMAWPLQVVMPGSLAWHHALQQQWRGVAPECVVMVGRDRLWCLLAGPGDAWHSASWPPASWPTAAEASAREAGPERWALLEQHLQAAVVTWPPTDVHCALWVEDAEQAAAWAQALTAFWQRSGVAQALRVSTAMAPDADGAARGAVCAWQVARWQS